VVIDNNRLVFGIEIVHNLSCHPILWSCTAIIVHHLLWFQLWRQLWIINDGQRFAYAKKS